MSFLCRRVLSCPLPPPRNQSESANLEMKTVYGLHPEICPKHLTMINELRILYNRLQILHNRLWIRKMDYGFDNRSRIIAKNKFEILNMCQNF